ncbi:M15 family metallopeptidase [Streptomyces clavuligerus]|uniref:M15 family metallopeptidase n=1 Tax=Streptomyces clavuligerus TaxID=1901 RepID=UPI0027D9D0A2|nr:M15 family metallopeptidase [Streptomyces clavuligerus]
MSSQSPSNSSSPSLRPGGAPTTDESAQGAGPAARAEGLLDTARGRPSGSAGSTAGAESGAVGSGARITPFDTEHPAVAGLDEELRTALQRAARKAREDGIEFSVTSGWRSKEYQQRLLDDAIRKHGSREKARKWVGTPETSAHVTGKAVDIGPTDADDWLIRKGAAFGLCQVYANEMWHFELRTEPGGRCPAPLPDASAG